jgi:hypothetical protein
LTTTRLSSPHAPSLHTTSLPIVNSVASLMRDASRLVDGRPRRILPRLRRAVVVSPVSDRNAKALPAYARAAPAGPIVVSLVTQRDTAA